METASLRAGAVSLGFDTEIRSPAGHRLPPVCCISRRQRCHEGYFAAEIHLRLAAGDARGWFRRLRAGGERARPVRDVLNPDSGRESQ